MEENNNRLLLFLLFGRMFPISPSWLLNVVAPFLNVPIHLFVLSVLLGLAPYNFICVQAGVILSQLRSWHDVLDVWTLLKLSVVAAVPLVLALWLRPPVAAAQRSCPFPPSHSLFSTYTILPDLAKPQSPRRIASPSVQLPEKQHPVHIV